MFHTMYGIMYREEKHGSRDVFSIGMGMREYSGIQVDGEDRKVARGAYSLHVG